MIISKQGDYAIRTMLTLGQRHPESISIREIASLQEIPKPFLNKIIQTLAKAGLVETIRGSQGGVKLWLSPRQVTLKTVIEAIDGPIVVNRCLIGSDVCSRSSFCAAHVVLANARKVFLAELEKTTLAKLVVEQIKLEKLT